MMSFECSDSNTGNPPTHVELMGLFDDFYALLATGQGAASEYRISPHLDSVSTTIPIDGLPLIVVTADVAEVLSSDRIDCPVTPSIFSPGGLSEDDPEVPFSHYDFHKDSNTVRHVGDTAYTEATPISRKAIRIALQKGIDSMRRKTL